MLSQAELSYIFLIEKAWPNGNQRRHTPYLQACTKSYNSYFTFYVNTPHRIQGCQTYTLNNKSVCFTHTNCHQSALPSYNIPCSSPSNKHAIVFDRYIHRAAHPQHRINGFINKNRGHPYSRRVYQQYPLPVDSTAASKTRVLYIGICVANP